MQIERKDADGFSKGPLDDILTVYEVEMIVERITPIDIKEYGSEKFFLINLTQITFLIDGLTNRTHYRN
jgi:hypothetical protein